MLHELAGSLVGEEQFRAVDQDHLGRAGDDVVEPEELADPFAHMLLVSLNEIATMIARSDDPETAMRDGRSAVEEYLRRLLPAVGQDHGHADSRGLRD
jgi:hypothetical protein